MRKPTTRNLWIGIFDRHYHALDSSINQRVCARRSAALMGMRLERNEGGTAACSFAGLFQCHCFGVLHVIVKIEAFTRDLSACIDDDGAHQRSGTNLGYTLGSEF